jgi:glycosyltransferase involved in cell wall biosynthesis
VSTVESVVAQIYPNWEIIIVDDGSTDGTRDIAEGLKAHYAEHAISVLYQPNSGLSAARNAGIQAGRGEYLFLLDADDLIEPEMLAETVAVLETRPDVGFVYTDVQMFGEEVTTWSGGAYRWDKLLIDCPLMPETLFRRTAWAMTSGFRLNLVPQGYEDWDFWLSIAEAGWEGWHIPRPLVRYRRTSGSMLAHARRYDLELRAQIMLNHPTIYPPAFVRWARRVYRPRYLHNGAFHPAHRWLRVFAEYLLLVAVWYPWALPKTLVRPVFCRLPARQQGYARRLARLLGMTQERL